MRSPALAFAIGVGLSTSLCSCRSTVGGTPLERHESREIWWQAAEQQWNQPWQRTPEVAALIATPVLALFDYDLSDVSADDYLPGGNTISGDVLALTIGGAALIDGAFEGLHGDGGQAFETGAESLFLTGLSTEVLKAITRRKRPDGTDDDSFPSGHTSIAFAGATFLARRIEDSNEGPYDKLGYLLYLPALYVAIDRVTSSRHFVSDVAFGAFLGMFTTNLVYNAHYGDESRDRPNIFGSRKSLHWSIGPALIDDRLGLCLDIGF